MVLHRLQVESDHPNLAFQPAIDLVVAALADQEDIDHLVGVIDFVVDAILAAVYPVAGADVLQS